MIIIHLPSARQVVIIHLPSARQVVIIHLPSARQVVIIHLPSARHVARHKRFPLDDYSCLNISVSVQQTFFNIVTAATMSKTICGTEWGK